MLAYGTMSRTALALVMVAASASAASAGGFVGLGIGTGAASSGDIDIDEDGRSGRLMVGYSFGRFAIEGMGIRYDMVTPDAHEWTGTTLALAGRFTLPLQDNFGVFGRLGLQRTDLSDKDYDAENEGTGLLVGAGAQFKLPIAAADVAVFVDYTIVRSSLSNPSYRDLSLTSRFWTLGATIGF